MTGLGGNIFVVDDPNQASDQHSSAGRQKVIDLYRGTLVSRANNARRLVIIVQQRIYVEDLSGYLLENDPDDWVHLNLRSRCTTSG